MHISLQYQAAALQIHIQAQLQVLVGMLVAPVSSRVCVHTVYDYLLSQIRRHEVNEGRTEMYLIETVKKNDLFIDIYMTNSGRFNTQYREQD